MEPVPLPGAPPVRCDGGSARLLPARGSELNASGQQGKGWHEDGGSVHSEVGVPEPPVRGEEGLAQKGGVLVLLAPVSHRSLTVLENLCF